MQKGPLLSNVSLPLCCIVSRIMMEMMRWTIALYSAALANCSLGHSLLSPLSFLAVTSRHDQPALAPLCRLCSKEAYIV